MISFCSVIAICFGGSFYWDTVFVLCAAFRRHKRVDR